jgi:hypothetical protein
MLLEWELAYVAPHAWQSTAVRRGSPDPPARDPTAEAWLPAAWGCCYSGPWAMIEVCCDSSCPDRCSPSAEGHIVPCFESRHLLPAGCTGSNVHSPCPASPAMIAAFAAVSRPEPWGCREWMEMTGWMDRAARAVALGAARTMSWARAARRTAWRWACCSGAVGAGSSPRRWGRWCSG